MTTLIDHRRAVDALRARHRLAADRADREREALDAAGGRETSATEAQGIVQHIAQALQQRAHRRISRVVSRCLAVVFDDPYEFRIDFERKRGKTEARLTFVRDGLVLSDPLNEVGGGVVDVASLALRLACLLLARPVRRRLVVLDEPFTCMRGKENRGRMRSLLLKLSEEMGFQFVLNVDGDAYPEFALGKIVELT